MISSRIVDLIPFQPMHIKKTYEWLNDKKLRDNFGIKQIATYEEHVRYFSRKLESPQERVYAVILEENHIGNCGFKNIDTTL